MHLNHGLSRKQLDEPRITLLAILLMHNQSILGGIAFG
jgi:hypothetical protein